MFFVMQILTKWSVCIIKKMIDICDTPKFRKKNILIFQFTRGYYFTPSNYIPMYTVLPLKFELLKQILNLQLLRFKIF